MSNCTDIRELFSLVLENEADEAAIARVRDHLDGCSDCAGLFDAMATIVETSDFMAEIEPPSHISTEISDSPCRRWLGLLYQAVDREITQHNLERLLTHLDSCPSCRQVWQDLTLVHQVGEAMEPPSHLAGACVRVRETIARITILPRRTATAAAYVLALLATLAIGNPTIIAQEVQAVAAESVSKAATGVSEVAADGRGEARVALWRAMRWGESKIDAVRGWVDGLRNDDEKTGDVEATPDVTPQGESS